MDFSKIFINKIDFESFINKFIFVLITIGVLWIIYNIILYFSFKKIKDVQFLYHFKKTLYYTIIASGILIGILVWFENMHSLFTFIGLTSAGIAIALREPIANFAGWFFILWRKPFEVKDRIEIGDKAGDVIDQRIFLFTILEIGNWVKGDQSTGRIIHIPNSKVFNTPISNYSKGFKYIWNEISVYISCESDWKKAKEIIKEIANKHTKDLIDKAADEIKEASKKFMIFYNKLTPIVYINLDIYGLELTLRYLCEPRKKRISSQVILEEILDEFKNADIKLKHS